MLLGPIKAMESVRTATPLKVRVLGCGWFGAHLSLALIDAGHDVEVWESADHIFAGASGANPARLHLGPTHYPRSAATQRACQEHQPLFMARYGHLTRPIPTNLYCIAAHDSLIDFETYRQVLARHIEFITVHDPAEYGLAHVEGAVLTGERHILIADARAHFEKALAGRVQFGKPIGEVDDPRWDLNIDATFCSLEAEAIDRYEPCLTVLLEGPTDRGVTIMDGGFPSVLPWSEADGLCSLTSALYTPLSKSCRTWAEARQMLRDVTSDELADRACAMLDQIAHFWPTARDLFRIVDLKTSIRAMPRSGADARLVDVVQVGERALRVRAGKIDAVFRAEALIMERIGA